MIILTALIIMTLVYVVSRHFPYPYGDILGVILFLAVSIHGHIFIDFAGLQSNLGNLFFAGTMMMLTILVLRCGLDHGRTFINKTFFALCALTLLTAMAENVQGVIQLDLRIAIASFVAFYGVQSLFVYLLASVCRHKLMLAEVFFITVFIQILDSVVFFPVAFAGVDIPFDLWTVAIDGFIIKALFAAASTPFIYAALRPKLHE